MENNRTKRNEELQVGWWWWMGDLGAVRFYVE